MIPTKALACSVGVADRKLTYVQAITSTTDRLSSMIYRYRHFKSSHGFHISTDDVINFRHIAFGTNSSIYREIR